MNQSSFKRKVDRGRLFMAKTIRRHPSHCLPSSSQEVGEIILPGLSLNLSHPGTSILFMITGSYRLAGSLWTTGNISELCQDVAQHCQIPPSSQAALRSAVGHAGSRPAAGPQIPHCSVAYVQDLGNVCDHWE